MGYLKMMCSCLDLMKMAKMENDIPSRDVVVDSNSKTMRANPKPPEWDTEGMPPMSKCLAGPTIRPSLSSKK